jgi:hypothetical protein
MGDLERGRIYRVTPKGHKGYNVPALDFGSTEGAIKAMANPNEEVRYLAWNVLAKAGENALPAMREAAMASGDPRYAARIGWIAAKMPGRAGRLIDRVLARSEDDLRCMGLRVARESSEDIAAVVAKVVEDKSPAVRREAAISLRFSKSPEMPKLWAKLAQQHTAGDRWSIEALGIGAALRWDECMGEYLKLVPNAADSSSGRDVIWRSRAKNTPELLAKIVKNPQTPEAEKDRYMRAFDFQQKGPEKDKALESLLQ